MKGRRIDLAEVGVLLLEQHEALRRDAASCVELATRLCAGEGVATQLAALLRSLRDAFLEHNELEHRLLEPYLAASDAWGPQRVERMLEEHAAEHAAFLDQLDGTTAEVAARLADFAEDLEAHMAAEERTFLSPRVLADAMRAR